MTDITTINWAQIPLREIKSRLDPALPGVFDIYQKSFPLEEQMLLSFFWKLLEKKEKGEEEQFHLTVLAHEKAVAAFVLYEIGKEVEGLGRGGYAWYLATNPDMRGGGIGKRLYTHLCEDLFLKHNCRGLFFEIEESSDVLTRHGQVTADYADWRKEWYKRQGAFELRGTRYLCGVGWQPAIPMQVMVHPNGSLTPEEALLLAHDIQDAAIEVIGELALL